MHTHRGVNPRGPLFHQLDMGYQFQMDGVRTSIKKECIRRRSSELQRPPRGRFRNLLDNWRGKPSV